MNPYALGMRLFQYIEEMADKGKFSYEFQRLTNAHERKNFDKKTSKGQEFIFSVRKHLSDFLFINTFLDQDFLDQHDLFVAGKRLNRNRMVWEYYVKSRKVEDYRQMVLDSLYHPPRIDVDLEKSEKGVLYLNHRFEGKPLYRDFIPNTMLGINYLWGDKVQLETTEVVEKPKARKPSLVFYQPKESEKKELQYQRVLLTVENRKLTRKVLQTL
jgi:stage V sporulation protein R